MYIDYVYYSEHGGGLSEHEFERHEPAAEAYIRYLTYVNGDIFATKSEPVMLALCAAVDTVAAHQAEAESGEAWIKSENNDGFSVSRVVTARDGETSEALVRRKVMSAVRPYLLPTGWLRRTMRRCGGVCL